MRQRRGIFDRRDGYQPVSTSDVEMVANPAPSAIDSSFTSIKPNSDYNEDKLKRDINHIYQGVCAEAQKELGIRLPVINLEINDGVLDKHLQQIEEVRKLENKLGIGNAWEHCSSRLNSNVVGKVACACAIGCACGLTVGTIIASRRVPGMMRIPESRIFREPRSPMNIAESATLRAVEGACIGAVSTIGLFVSAQYCDSSQAQERVQYFIDLFDEKADAWKILYRPAPAVPIAVR